MSIKIKLILTITITLVFLGFGMSGIVYWQNNKILTTHIGDDINVTINHTFQLVNFYIDKASGNLINLANDPIIISALETKNSDTLLAASQKITTIKEAVGNIENIALHQISGSSCIAITADQTATAVIGKDWSDRDYCKGIIENKATYVSSAFVSSISNKPVLAISTPVKNAKGETLGYIIGTLELDELRGYLWDLQKDSKVELLDRYKTMFLNTEENIETLNNLSATEEEELSKIESYSINNNNGYFRDEDNFVGYRSNNILTVIYEKKATSLLDLAQTLDFTIILFLLLMIVLTLIIVSFFIGLITKRISRLSLISEQIANGSFVKLEESDLKANDETAVLARAFNDMANKLSELYKNLEEKVILRTKEIEEKNKKLEELNKYMVGRELKMVELKKQIIESKKD